MIVMVLRWNKTRVQTEGCDADVPMLRADWSLLWQFAELWRNDH